MLLGEYQHSLDTKGRVTIPSRLRDGLGDRFVVTKGLDTCLFVYPLAEWDALEEKLRGLPLTRADARSFVRLLFSGAVECEPDKQGRILLPPNLRTHARLEKDVYLLGVSNRVEIWDKEIWEQYSLQAAASYEQVAEQLDGLGI
ncbi:MAG: division/cell wall cluster transcriptional repressor MraZ [Firmicutes bacterium]|nr:division/cell wall cluster transcriptional repressor MraZ [Bacillota bacterium]